MDTEWMGNGKCKDLDPTIFFPNDWVGVQVAQRICRGLPREESLPRVRTGESGRPRGLGRGFGAGTSPDPKAAPPEQGASRPRLSTAALRGPGKALNASRT